MGGRAWAPPVLLPLCWGHDLTLPVAGTMVRAKPSRGGVLHLCANTLWLLESTQPSFLIKGSRRGLDTDGKHRRASTLLQVGMCDPTAHCSSGFLVVVSSCGGAAGAAACW